MATYRVPTDDDLSGKLGGQQQNAIATGTSPVYLPTVAVAPSLVVSTSRLVYGYSGSAVRVQRASDDVEQNISFNGRFLDTVAAASFRGASSLGIKTWYDQSGGLWDQAQATKASQPVLNAANSYSGAPSISFDSFQLTPTTSKRMVNLSGPTIDKGNVTVFMVLAPNFSFQDNTYIVSPDSSNTLAVYTRSNNVGLVANSTIVYNSAGTANGRLIPPLTPSVIAFKAGPVNASHRLNGLKYDTAGAATAGSIVGVTLGKTATFGATFDGRFDALAYIVYPAALSDADCALVEAALYSAFSIVSNQTAKIVFDGDSRVEGYGATNNRPWTRLVLPQLSKAVYTASMGVAGQTLQTMAANVAARVNNLYDATRTKNIVVMGGPGINDFSASRTALQVEADFQTYANGIHASQLLIAATVPLHTGHTAPQIAERAAYNVWLRANWPTYADGFVDLDADPNIGTATNLYDPVHYNDVGHAYWAAAFAPAINALL